MNESKISKDSNKSKTFSDKINKYLSGRMKAIADMVTPGKVVADVGCDHGYISIYLIQKEICQKAIAMDVAGGPLGTAKANVEEMELTDHIELRLSDGFEKLLPGEADRVVIAGMGGMLMINILDSGRDKLFQGTELILSPQSDQMQVRKYLRKNGFRIIDEKMMLEDGKYYNIIRAEKENEMLGKSATVSSDNDTDIMELYDRYGEHLIKRHDPVLTDYLLRELEKKNSIFCHISKAAGDNAMSRMAELTKEIKDIEYILSGV